MILEARNISKSFYNNTGKLNVFSDLSLTIEKKDLITIMGPSGSGKSTLLNILGTLEAYDEGILNINGKEIVKQNNDSLSRIRNEYLGFVFQFHHLLPEFTALENVMMPGLIARRGRKETRELAENAIEAVEKIPNPAIEIKIYNKDSIICIEIKDNGIGIDDKMISKIFEPYFTTKAKGTWLGLSIVKRIIEDH